MVGSRSCSTAGPTSSSPLLRSSLGAGRAPEPFGLQQPVPSQSLSASELCVSSCHHLPSVNTLCMSSKPGECTETVHLEALHRLHRCWGSSVLLPAPCRVQWFRKHAGSTFRQGGEATPCVCRLMSPTAWWCSCLTTFPFTAPENPLLLSGDSPLFIFNTVAKETRLLGVVFSLSSIFFFLRELNLPEHLASSRASHLWNCPGRRNEAGWEMV